MNDADLFEGVLTNLRCAGFEVRLSADQTRFLEEQRAERDAERRRQWIHEQAAQDTHWGIF